MPSDSLTITDNRNGKQYEVPIRYGTYPTYGASIDALDLRQIKVSDEDFGLLTHDPGFTNTSLLMAALAVILTGKGLHALQETGGLSATPTRWHWTWDLVGVYATWETILAPFMILALVYVLWIAGNRPAARSV